MSDSPPKIRGGTKLRGGGFLPPPQSSGEDNNSNPPPANVQVQQHPPQSAPQGRPPQSPTVPEPSEHNHIDDDAEDEVVEEQEEEHYQVRQQQQPPTPSARSSGGGGGSMMSTRSSADLSEVKNLLKQATEDIRQYKGKIKELEQEKARLKDSNAINAKRLAKMPTVSSSNHEVLPAQQTVDESKLPNGAASGIGGGFAGYNTTTSSLKQKLQDLSIENHLAVEKLAGQHRRIHELEATVDAQNKEMDKMRKGQTSNTTSSMKMALGVRRTVAAAGPSSSPRRREQEGVMPSGNVRASSASGSLSSRREGAHRQSPSGSGAHNRSHDNENPPTTATRERMPPRGHHFDALASVQLSHTAAAAAVTHHHNASPGQYDEMMMNRFRRSLAPAPKTEEMGEVVHAIVRQLAFQMKQQGTLLPLTKVQPCVYKFPTNHHYAKPFPGMNPSRKASEATCFKKIHLSVDSGRLVVKGGGGHTDFMEYLERNHIAVPIE